MDNFDINNIDNFLKQFSVPSANILDDNNKNNQISSKQSVIDSNKTELPLQTSSTMKKPSASITKTEAPKEIKKVEDINLPIQKKQIKPEGKIVAPPKINRPIVNPVNSNQNVKTNQMVNKPVEQKMKDNQLLTKNINEGISIFDQISQNNRNLIEKKKEIFADIDLENIEPTVYENNYNNNVKEKKLKNDIIEPNVNKVIEPTINNNNKDNKSEINIPKKFEISKVESKSKSKEETKVNKIDKNDNNVNKSVFVFRRDFLICLNGNKIVFSTFEENNSIENILKQRYFPLNYSEGNLKFIIRFKYKEIKRLLSIF